MKLIPELLRSADPILSGTGDFPATLEAHGLFNTFQFVLRLSPAVHRQLAGAQDGIARSSEIGFERAQAFST